MSQTQKKAVNLGKVKKMTEERTKYSNQSQNQEYQNMVREAALQLERTGTLNINNSTVLMRIVRDGVDYGAFEQLLSRYPFSIEEWSNYLHISERTLQRYKKHNTAFDSLQSEKILQITLLYQRGTEIFGSNDYFDTWLNTVSVALGQIKPKELLDNAFGISLLNDELTRIEHGVLA